MENAFDHYYEGNMPVNLTRWMEEYSPRKTLIFREAGGGQLRFVDETIRDLFRSGSKRDEKSFIAAISTHRSKSVILPVYQIVFEKGKKKVEFVLRGNFHDWNVSVDSDFSLEGLFNKEQRLFDVNSTDYCFFQGFPSDKVYGCYKNGPDHFSACIDDDFKLYVFLFLIRDRIREYS